jgi:hypothetical protein
MGWRPREEDDAMNEYLFLYRGGGRPAGWSPEQMQKHTAKWMTWVKSLGEQGALKEPGHPLEPEVKIVRSNGQAVTDGPFAEAKDVIGGYSIVTARDLDAAAALTKDCPNFDVGGVVEVRPIRQM